MLTFSTTRVVVLGLALADCGGGGPEATPSSKAEPAVQPAKAKSKVSALARAEQAVTKPMPHHFASARNLEHAVVEGDLEAAHLAAGAVLGERPDTYPEAWAPYLFAQRNAAQEVLRSRELVEAAEAAGRLAATCGRCHAALGRGPEVPQPVEPPECTDDATGMRAHAWAVEQMWWGIAAPSDAAWARGTRRFAELPGCLPTSEGEGLEHAAITAVRNQVHDLSTRAGDAETPELRAAVYGEYLGTCATCHVAGC